MPSSDRECLLLTGYMGAGKSTIGRLLAEKLGYEFQDTDKVLVGQFGKSIARIFAEDGEDAFRQAEVDALTSVGGLKRVVVSTGGGTLTREATFKLAQSHGTIIYLKAPVEVLYERVIFSPRERPMLDVPDAEARFKTRFEEREPYYNRAHLIVETSDGQQARPQEAVVDEIIDRLGLREVTR